jgi:hypothetical protein
MHGRRETIPNIPGKSLIGILVSYHPVSENASNTEPTRAIALPP